MPHEIVLQVPDDDWTIWSRAWLERPETASLYQDADGKHLPLDEYAPLDIVVTINRLLADNLRQRVALERRTVPEIWAVHQAIEDYHNRKAEVENDATD